MISTQNVKLTIEFTDLTLEAEERDIEVLRLLSDLKELDSIEAVYRVSSPHAIALSKSVGSFFVGILTAEISVQNTKNALRFLSSRLSGKPIELEVDANGKQLKVTANNVEELKAAISAAQNFISS